MRRIVNFRAPLFVAIGIVLGIFSFYEFLFGNFWFGLVTLVLLIVLGVTLFLLKSKVWLGIIAVILAVILGFGLSYGNYELLNRNEAINVDVLLTGRVCDLNRNGGENGATYLEDCVDDNGVKYKGRIKTYIFDSVPQTGDRVTIRGKLNSVYPIKNDVESYYLRANVRYELDVEMVVMSKKGSHKLDEIIRKYVYDVSAEYAPQNGDVIYALLTGDRTALSVEKETYFKSAGIIHLLAVSGLHVGFVVGALCLVLKRFKLYPLIECAILLVPLILYAYICSFTPSVIRAIVMVVCSYVARAVFGRYDLLTSLSFAVIVILLISPFSLFDVGFQLSALSIYGIATLFLALNRILSKRKINKFLRYLLNSVAVSLSCSFATFFTMQLNFGYAPVLGILLNIIVIPTVTVAFILSWIGMVPWIFHYIMWLVDWILEFVVVAAKWIAGLSFATVSLSSVALAVVIVAVWLFVSGGYVNLRKVGKIVAHSTLAFAVALCVGLSFVKVKPDTQTYVSYSYDEVMCVTTSTSGEAAIVGNFGNEHSYSQAVSYICKYKITTCRLYITDYSQANANIIADALERLPVSVAYKLDNSLNNEADYIFDKYDITVYRQMDNSSSGDSVVVTSLFNGGLRAVIMQSDNLTVTTVYGNDYAVANYLNLGITSDVYVLPRANEAYATENLLTLSLYQSQLPFNYGANKYGNFTIVQKGATISIKFR